MCTQVSVKAVLALKLLGNDRRTPTAHAQRQRRSSGLVADPSCLLRYKGHACLQHVHYTCICTLPAAKVSHLLHCDETTVCFAVD